ncbi:DUF4339 domain-containing protein [Hyphomicrobium sp.]|uniref:DUF4339 domain-containing protein n=1 Tax=Hyphomicrobium sp. TaxID=82 RepID=UPI0025BBF74B|nr:DUF4339 domain-containing protein [Hyphomicrobium sp.]MCC7253385.1 DUF4339 domain-containing protein [Hyphomicrobium sp.]
MSGSETDIQWFIARDGKQHGPVSDLELKKIVELAHLKPTDLVWRQGFTDWRVAASVVPEIAPAPAPSPAQEPSPPAATAPASAAPKPAAAPQATASNAPAPQSHAPYTPGPSRQESWRPQGETTRPDQMATRPLGNPPLRTAGPFPAGGARPGPGPGPGPGPTAGPSPALRATTDSRKPSEMTAPLRDPAPPAPSRGRRLALVATGLVAMAGAGFWLSSQYTDQILSFIQTQSGAPVQTGTTTANLVPSGEPSPAAPAAAAPAVPTTDEIDRKLQNRTMWVAVKQEFPDWYQARVAEVARLSAARKEQPEITRYLIEELVALRRENAKHALAASTVRHKELAAAFLANLNQLSQESGDGCYDFISKGESSPTIVARLDDPAKSAEIEAQVVAIVSAIVEGRKQPSEHAAPVKTDYDVLAGELGRLGWTQADMQLFANPKALAQAPRARVCNMLKDWFTAHLAIQDPNTQERLLFETLKPVISG